MRRLVLLASVIVFVDTVFFATVAPLLPHYVHELHLSKSEAGVLAGSYAAGTLLGALPGGWLAVRVGVKPTVLVGLALLSASSVAFGFAHHVVLLDGARFVQGLGGACTWSGALAWLIGAAPPDRRGELIGTALGAAIAGELLGPAVGALADAVGTEPVFGAVPAVGAAIAVWVLRTPVRQPAALAGAGTLAALGRGRVRTGMWLVALPALCFGVMTVLVPLRMGHLGAGSAAVAATFVAAGAMEMLVSPAVGRLSDRRGRLLPIRVGLVLSTPLLLVLAWPRNAVLLAVLVVLCSGALGTFWAPAMALLSDAAADAGLGQGVAFALTNLAWASGHTVGSGGSGALAAALADAAPYGLVAGMCLVTLAGLRARRRAMAAA